MYRQILIHSEHRKFQKILWHFNPNDPLNIYELNNVTYGLAPSTIRALHQLAIVERNRFPNVVKFISENMYVDDALFGADSIQESIDISRKFSDCLKVGGFPLTKWSVNSSKLLSHIPSDWLEINPNESQNLTKDQKLIGILWNSNSDILSFSVKSHSEFEPVTKRKLLSMIARLYNPLRLRADNFFDVS